MRGDRLALSEIFVKTTLVHVCTYFVVGLTAFLFLDYAARYADPDVRILMRQTDHPLVVAGPLFQVLRGFLFAWVFFTFRQTIFDRPYGWRGAWLMFLVVGVASPFGAAPASIEGLVYTTLPLSFHAAGLPEIVVQSLLLAFLTHYWVTHPSKWLSWLFGMFFALIIVLSVTGVLLASGMLSR